MGRYITWEDVVDRYPEIDTVGGADQISSSYIVYAESYLDGILATHFVTPFSQEVMIIKDLAIDFTYWRAGRFKLDNAVEVKSAFYETIGMLKAGQIALVDEDGVQIPALDSNAGIWSNTMSFSGVFGTDDPLNWGVDEDEEDYYTDRR